MACRFGGDVPGEQKKVEVWPICVRDNNLPIRRGDAKNDRGSDRPPREARRQLATRGGTTAAPGVAAAVAAEKGREVRTIPSGTAPSHPGVVRLPTRTTACCSAESGAAASARALRGEGAVSGGGRLAHRFLDKARQPVRELVMAGQ